MADWIEKAKAVTESSQKTKSSTAAWITKAQGMSEAPQGEIYVPHTSAQALAAQKAREELSALVYGSGKQSSVAERNETYTKNRLKALAEYKAALELGMPDDVIRSSREAYEASLDADPLAVALREERAARARLVALSGNDPIGAGSAATDKLYTEYLKAGDKVEEAGGKRNSVALVAGAKQYGGTLLGGAAAAMTDIGRGELAQEAANTTDRQMADMLWQEYDRLNADQSDFEKKMSALSEEGAEELETAKFGRSKAGQILTDVGVQAVSMAADAGLGLLTGGGALLPMAIRSYGGGSQQAFANGGNRDKAALVGAANAAVELVSEKMFDVLGIYGGGLGDDAAEKIVDYVIGRLAKSDSGQLAWKLLFSFGGEALEEVFSGVAEPLINSVYNGKSVRENYSDMEIGDLMYDAFIGGVLGLAGGATSVAANGNQKGTYRIAGEQNAGLSAAKFADQTFGQMADGADALELGREYRQIQLNDARSRSEEGGTARRLANELAEKLSRGKGISERSMAQLTSALASEETARRVAADTAKAAERLRTVGETENVNEVAAAIARKVHGEELNGWDEMYLANSRHAKTIIDELMATKAAAESAPGTTRTAVSTPKTVNYNAKARKIVDDPELLRLFEEQYGVEIQGSKSQQRNAVADILRTQEEAAAGKTVTVEGIDSVENGVAKVRLSTGEVVKATDVDFGSDTENELYELFGGSGLNASAMEEAIRSYDGSLPTEEYVAAVREAYLSGQYGINENAPSSGGLAEKLSEAQYQTAWKLGQIFKDEATPDAEEAARLKGGNKGKGQVVNRTGRSLHRPSLSATQKAAVRLSQVLAKVIGNDVVIYESRYQDGAWRLTQDIPALNLKAGTAVDNGYYRRDGSGTVYIDLNAGMDSDSSAARTLAHEYTHFVKEWSPEAFRTLADFLMSRYGESGTDATELISAQQQKAAQEGRSISTETAYEEVVADSMETMLTDSNAVERLVELKKTDSRLFDKLHETVNKFLAAIKSVFSDIVPESEEGKLVMQMQDSYQQLSDLFADALNRASENYQETGYGDVAGENAEEADIQRSGRAVPTEDNNANWNFPRHSLYSVSAEELSKMENWAGRFKDDLGNKSPFFRAWFGEWRENDRYPRFNKRKTIPIKSGITMADVYADRKSGTSSISGSSTSTNSDTGMNIEYGKLLVKDTMSKTQPPPNFDEATASALYYIDDIIRNAILLDTELSEPTKSNKATTTAFMHKFYLPINMKDSNNSVTRYIAKLSVEQFVQANSPKQRAYNLQAIEMLPLSRAPSPGNPGTGHVGLNGSIWSIADLIDAVKMVDPDFNPKSSSKVVDANGNPMVMYHGTNQGGFSSFDPNAARDGASFFFTNSYDVAKTYTVNGHETAQVYPVYLNLQNPLMIDAEGEWGVDWTSVPFMGERKSTYDIADYAKKNGYDGVLIKGLADIGGRSEFGYSPDYPTDGHDYTAIVFDPNNIKSASENIGTYSSESSDIYRSTRSTGLDSRTILEGYEPQNDLESRMVGKYLTALEQLRSIENELAGQREALKSLQDASPRDRTAIRTQREAILANENRVTTLTESLARQEKGATLNRIIERERAAAISEAYERGRFDQGYENRGYEEALRGKEKQRKKDVADTKAAAKERLERTVAADKQKLEDTRASYQERMRNREAAWTAEREAARQRLKDTRAENLRKQQEIRDTYRDRIAGDVERRKRNELKRGIQKKVSELNDMLRGNKVLIGMQKTVAEALDAINMDTVDAQNRIREIDTRIAAAKSQNEVERLLAYRDRIAKSGDTLGAKLSALRTAYDEIINSDDPMIAGAHDEVISELITQTANTVGDTPLRNMSLDQLEAVKKLYTAVLTNVRNANKTFKAGKAATVGALSEATLAELNGSKGWRFAQKESPAIFKRGDPLSTVRKFMWQDLKPVYAFKAIGSKTLNTLFSNIRAGEDSWYRDVSEAKSFAQEQKRKYGHKSWDMEQTWEFTSSSGLSFSLSLGDIMSIYAYSKREAAADHLAKGGIVFENSLDATAYNLSYDLINEITDVLTPEQRGYVDAMQHYLSSVMGEKGNEVTLEMYGVKLYGEENYFPLRSAGQYMAKAKEAAKAQPKLKNSGFSKTTVPHASNPIIMDSFDSVWASHVNEMSMYHSFVLPMEDFYRVWNYKTKATEDTAIESVNAAIQNKFGKEAVQYIDTLLTDLNGGARSDPAAGLIGKGLSLFKKGATFASLSVVIQQPSAIGRAFAYIDPKYFSARLKGYDRIWEECKKYAPIAGIKEMGAFDTDMGRTTEDYINGSEYDTLEEKLKALATDGDYRDEVLGKAPELADELTWCAIWEAAKRQTSAQTGLTGEALRQKAAELFTETITHTQVYDSVLSRSGLMRSKDTGMKMVTSFMAEPTTSINMLADALINRSRGDGRMAARQVGALTTSITLNAVLQSVIYAMRDDDDDESYAEKYVASLTDNLKSGFNPLNMVPFFRDVVSITSGYDVERTDMSVISDLWSAYKALGRDDLSTYRKVEDFGGSLAKILGLPVKNVMRDVRGIWNTVTNTLTERSTAAGIRDAVLEGLTGNTKSDTQQLYIAMVRGDKAQVERVSARFDSESAMHSAIRKAMRDNDSRIASAAQARADGKSSEYLRIFDEIAGEGIFAKEDILGAIEAEEQKIRDAAASEQAKEYIAKAKSVGNATDFANAVISGDYSSAKTFKADIIATHMANGKSSSEAAHAFNTAASAALKEAYMAGDISAGTAGNALVNYLEMSRENATDRTNDWAFEKQNGWSYSDRRNEYLSGNITREQLIKAMVSRGSTRDDAVITAETYDWNKSGFDVTTSAVEKYMEKLEGKVSKADYYQAWTIYNDTQGVDANGDGKTDSGSKAKAVMSRWAAELDVSADKLTLLAQAWWADSTIQKYKAW